MRATSTVPPRVRWAVGLLDVAPDAHVLEIGCGPGAGVELVLPLVPEGHVTAVDRSVTAVERTLERNAEAGGSRLTVLRSTLADLFLEHGPVDVAFAVDVNVFWVEDATAELAVLRHVLRPGGRLHVVYGGEGPTTGERVVEPIRRHLGGRGWDDVVHTRGAQAFALSATRV